MAKPYHGPSPIRRRREKDVSSHTSSDRARVLWCILWVSVCLVSSVVVCTSAEASEANSVVFGGKLGIPILDHAGEWTFCSSSTTACNGSRVDLVAADGVTTFNTDFSLYSAYRFNDWLRAGVRLGWIPNVTFADKLTSAQQNWGKAIDLTAEVGLTPEIAQSTAFILEARAGARVLISGGDLASAEQVARNGCVETVAKGAICSTTESPYSSLLIGFAGGIRHEVGPVNLLLELDWSYANFENLARFEASSAKTSALVEMSLHEWYRLGITFGVETR